MQILSVHALCRPPSARGYVLSFVARYAVPCSACWSIDKGGPLIKINALVVNELSARPSIRLFRPDRTPDARSVSSPPTTLPREYPDVCQTFSCRDLSESAPTNWPARQKARPSFRRVRIPAGCYRNRRIPLVPFCRRANRQTLAVAYAQDFSITRNETTR